MIFKLAFNSIWLRFKFTHLYNYRKENSKTLKKKKNLECRLSLDKISWIKYLCFINGGISTFLVIRFRLQVRRHSNRGVLIFEKIIPWNKLAFINYKYSAKIVLRIFLNIYNAIQLLAFKLLLRMCARTEFYILI